MSASSCILASGADLSIQYAGDTRTVHIHACAVVIEHHHTVQLRRIRIELAAQLGDRLTVDTNVAAVAGNGITICTNTGLIAVDTPEVGIDALGVGADRLLLLEQLPAGHGFLAACTDGTVGHAP